MVSLKPKLRLFVGAAALMTFGATSLAYAADGSAAGGEAVSASTTSVEEVVVTARKRTESDMAVPAVVSAISAEKIAAQGVSDIQGITSLTPQVIVSNSFGSTGGALSIRGVGSSPINGVDQTVALNLDGVQVSLAGASRIGQFDLARVEVLKGPQALFFGKNSPGGVISFVSEGPTQTLDSFLRASYEFEGREARVEGAVSGPISDTFGVRIAAFYDHMGGYFTNPLQAGLPGVFGPNYSRAPNYDEYGGRLTAKWAPTSDFTATLKLTYDNVYGTTSYAAAQLSYCPLGHPQSPVAIFGPNPDNCRIDKQAFPLSTVSPAIAALVPSLGKDPDRERSTQFLGGLNLEYQLGPHLSLTSQTGYYDYTLEGSVAQVGPMPGNVIAYPEDKRQWSEELRLQSSYGGPIDFVVGAYAESSYFDYDGTLYLLPVGVFNTNQYHQDGRAASVFGQLIWRPIEKVEVAAGARYTDETKTLDDHKYLTGDVTNLLKNRRINSTNTSPEVTVTYRPTDDLTLYGAYKTGFKSGGFNMSIAAAIAAGTDLSFGPEKAEGGEVGVKARLFDRTLRTNLAIYNYDYTNLQVSAFSPTTLAITVQNAASATIKGVDFDFTWAPRELPGFTLDGALGYNRARFNNFAGACYTGQTISQGCNLFPNAAGVFTSQDNSGRQLAAAPEWSGNLSANYRFEVGTGRHVELGGGLRYVGSENPAGDFAPGGKQKPVTFVDARAALAADNGAWEVALIGRNLTDQLRALVTFGQSSSGTAAGLATGTPADLQSFVNRPMEVRLQFTVRPQAWSR